MCGIHGKLYLRSPPADPAAVLSAMGQITRHRGPDDEGQYIDGGMLLGMRRLSIIDLAGGHQPISNETGDIWLVCNGEIYNFRELRAELIARGHRFRTGSDVEVIVHLYEEQGDACLARLNGMFGLALWDAKRQRLLVARDPLGVKPLYYQVTQDGVGFASEAKALLRLPGASARLDASAVAEYLNLGYVPAPYSIFEGIRKLRPAEKLVVERGEVRIERYWQLPREPVASASESEWIERLRAGLDAAVHAQMVSDVPLGAFLSGGIDSSAVVAAMARHSAQPVQTYSIGFAGSSGAALYNELPYARQVAQLFGTAHREIVVQPDVVRLLPRLLWHMDEPIADTAFITTYLVSEFARRDVTVILSGVGGDELFGGYNRYLDAHYRRLYHYLPGLLRNGVVAPLARLLPADRHNRWLNRSRLLRSFLLADQLSFEERYRRFVGVFDEAAIESMLRRAHDRPGAMRAALAGADHGDELRRLFEADLATQMPDDLLLLTDKMSMAVSLECRVPLLDLTLVDLAARMPSSLKIRNGTLKYSLKRALEGVLPREILYRAKRGFGAPVGAWIKSELAPLLDTLLSRESIERRGLFDWQAVERTRRLHAENREDHTDHLLALMNLEIWARMYLDDASHEDLAGQFRELLAA